MMELVRNNGFEPASGQPPNDATPKLDLPIVGWIDPRQPPKVVAHVGKGQSIPCVHDNGLNEQTGESRGNIERWSNGGKTSEQGVGRHGDNPEEQPKNEELPSCTLEVDQKVENNAEYKRRSGNDGL